MEFYYMVNYYFKYLELLDTVFLAFKKKPLGEHLYSSVQTSNLESLSLPARLPSLGHRTTMLYSIKRQN